MDIIYYLLREFRYIFKSRKIKKYLTIIIIYILFLFLLSAFSVSKASVEFTHNNNNVSLPDFPDDVGEHYCLFYSYQYRVYTVAYPATENFRQFFNDGNYWFTIKYLEGDKTDFFRVHEYKNGSWTSSVKSWGIRDFKDLDDSTSNTILLCTDNIYNNDGSVYFKANVNAFHSPYILNSAEDLASGSFDSLLIEPADFDLTSGNLYLHLLEPSYANSTDNIYYFTDTTYSLGVNSVYYKSFIYGESYTYSYFEIPQSSFSVDFKNGNTYFFVLNDSSSNLGGSYDTDSPTFSSSYDSRRFTISGLTADDIEYNRHNENIAAINNQTLSIQAQTNAINNQTSVIQGQTNAINEQTNKIEEQTNAINGTTQAVNDTNNFLKDNTVDDSQFNLPTVDVNDPTSNFFDTIFMGLYNAVTNNEEKTISFEILGNNISINSADFNYLNGNEWNVLRVILSSMWVFGIGIYILKDIRKMIDKIKDGNVENMSTDDIKANMV